ncbi:MFS transporter [Fructobacillus cardui]|uniref:MFS transporter n=1 Tax=Fructobacillus cardui TaxID=2893170 RepID=UPI00200B8F4E|nr:MFS transporter [Fructobacillus cardui]MCK8627942.1 MFS transporter [Fructobacillus cardui]
MPNTQSRWDPKTLNHRFWILAVSLSIATGKGIAPALPALQKAFSDYPTTMVNLLATIPQIPALIVLLFSGQLANRFGIKQVISTGILLMAVTGVLPSVLTNFWLIFATRLLFGVGIGLVNLLAITLIDFVYEGDNQAQMLGNRSAFEPIGLTIVNLSVGALLAVSWQVSFLAYDLLFIVWWGFIQVVPEYQPRQKSAHADLDRVTQHEHPKYLLPIIGSAAYCGLLTVGMSIINVYTPYLVLTHHLGGSMTSSVIITVYTLTSMVMGFLFGTFFHFLHRYIFLFGLFFMGAVFFYFARGLTTLTLSVIVVGLSYPMAGTYLFDTIANRVPKRMAGLANSILLVGCNAGTALAPAIVSALNIIGPKSALDGGIRLYGELMFALLLLTALLMWWSQKNRVRKSV